VAAAGKAGRSRAALCAVLRPIVNNHFRLATVGAGSNR